MESQKQSGHVSSSMGNGSGSDATNQSGEAPLWSYVTRLEK